MKSTHYFVFGVKHEDEQERIEVYAAEEIPFAGDSDPSIKNELEDLAKILVDRQFRHLRVGNECCDEHFPLSFNFTPPYDVKMQRQRLWHTRPLTQEERQIFLKTARAHYLSQSDPFTAESNDEDCVLY